MMRNMLKCCLLVVWMCILGSFTSANNSPSHFPEDVVSPMIYPQNCNRPRVAHSAVCDVDDVMSDASRDIIEGMLNEIVEYGAGKAAVCLVYQMSPVYIKEQGSIELAGEKFARTLHDTWGVGDAQKQDGVLLFMSIHDRIVYISTGSGVGEQFPSQVTDGIIAHMRPSLKNRDYSRALQTAVTEIDLVLKGQAVPHSSSRRRESSGSPENSAEAFGIIVFVFVVITSVILCVAHWDKNSTTHLRNGQRALDSLMREVEGGDSERFHSASCPICLEDFAPHPADGDATSGNAASTGAVPQAATDRVERESKSTLRPMMLPCDHQFCFGCLSEYLRTPEGTKCPICRAPLEPTAPIPRPEMPASYPENGAGAGAGGNGGAGGEGSGGFRRGYGLPGSGPGIWLRRSPEISYRINRMRHLYPDALDADAASRLQSAASTGPAELVAAIQSRSTQVTSLIDNATRRAAMKSSGSRGSSSRSFGGGRSSGGGGGRW